MNQPVNITIIGERINPGFKSSRALFDNEDIEGIQQLAKNQMGKGAKYLNINVGEKALTSRNFLVEVIKAIQNVVSIPLSFDFPNKDVQETCLKTYLPEKAGGQKPIMNSVSDLRLDMLDLIKIQPFKAILMASERIEDGVPKRNEDSENIYKTARNLSLKILQEYEGFSPDDLLIDVSVGPIGGGAIKTPVNAIRQIGSDKDLKGIHITVGLSNIGVMLPRHAADDSLLKWQVESSFLTLAIPLGLDTILATAGSKYFILPDDNFVFHIIKESMEFDGLDAVMHIRKLYHKG